MSTKESRIAAIDLAVERGGGIVRFAKAMGVSTQAVYHWKRRGWAPLDKAVVIETIFGIARDDLINPDILSALSAPSVAASVL